MFIADIVSSLLGKVFLGKSSEKFVYNLRVGISKTILFTNFENVQKFDKGDINNRTIEDVPIAQQPYFETYPNLINSVIIVIICIFGLFFSSWHLALSVIATFAIFGFFMLLILSRIESSAHLSRQTDSKYSSFLYETLYNFLLLKSTKSEGWALNHLRVRAAEAKQAGQKLVIWSALLLPVVNIATQISLVLVIVGGGYLITQGQLSFSSLATFLLFLIYMVSPLVSIATVMGELKESKVSQNRLLEIFKHMPIVSKRGNNPNIKISKNGSIFIKPFSYSYDESARISYPEIRIKGPTILAIIGSNGSGKSTLLNLISGVRGASLDSDGNGGDTFENPSIYYLPQGNDVFSVSVRENILLGLDKTDDDIFLAADIIGVRKFLNSLPSGLDTLIGGEGHGLSGGQKQIIHMLNMILSSYDVLMLDESTSNIDIGTRSLISEYLNDLSTKKLIIVISHDSEIIGNAREFVNLTKKD
ncbi:ABC transporter transmembrane domain-containing protein [Rothia nasisuis]|uniref:ABC transporter transmembrane domain-containing protein n=1 Tax=Rothia nasisuis TaxID=2109647 RepID=UPI001F4272B8|nr:ABC transporter ATP-binding protein [Rothia nasisuis]